MASRFTRVGLVFSALILFAGCAKDNSPLRLQSGLIGSWNGENAPRVVEFKSDGTGVIFDSTGRHQYRRAIKWDIAIAGTLRLWISDEDAGPGLSQHKFKFDRATDSFKFEQALPDGLAWHLKRRR